MIVLVFHRGLFIEISFKGNVLILEINEQNSIPFCLQYVMLPCIILFRICLSWLQENLTTVARKQASEFC